MKFRYVAASVATLLMNNLPSTAQAETVLRAVMSSDLKIIDPIWTSAYIVRDHGYMIYDTLFAMDGNGDIQLQMADKYSVSDDRLVHTIALRDGLEWHDGQPVTAEDCVASIKRWAVKDAMGQTMMSFVGELAAVDAKTIQFKLKAPTGLVKAALGKPSSNVPFMMPKRVADTDPNKQINDTTGSGPFIFKRDAWKPGDRVVYVKNTKYKPRPEPASGHAGGKIANLDRVEWLSISDAQQMVNALTSGEIDYLERPSHDLLPLITNDPNVKVLDVDRYGAQYAFRLNHLVKPFDNPKIREALWYAFNQKDFLDATIGNPKYFKTCLSFFPCGTRYASETVMDGRLGSNFKKAQEMLKEAGYDGTPIVLLHSTDVTRLTNMAPTAKQLMEKAGFKVDMMSMDWQSVVSRRSKKNPADQGGWSIFITTISAGDILDPVMSSYLASNGEQATAGWPNDPEMERLRGQFAAETDPAKMKALADAVQVQGVKATPYIPLGQFYQPPGSTQNRKRRGCGFNAGLLGNDTQIIDVRVSVFKRWTRHPECCGCGEQESACAKY